MKYASALGRVLFALIFVFGAPRHFTQEGIQHAAAHGVFLAGVLVPISGVLALAGGISVAIGYKAKWGALALVAFLVPVTLWMHAYWLLSDPAEIHIQSSMFFKNLSMLGAALMISYFGAGAVSIDRLHSTDRSVTTQA